MIYDTRRAPGLQGGEGPGSLYIRELVEGLARLRPLLSEEGYEYANGADLDGADVAYLRRALILGDLLSAILDLLGTCGHDGRPPDIVRLLIERGRRAAEELSRRSSLRMVWPPIRNAGDVDHHRGDGGRHAGDRHTRRLPRREEPKGPVAL